MKSLAKFASTSAVIAAAALAAAGCASTSSTTATTRAAAAHATPAAPKPTPAVATVKAVSTVPGGCNKLFTDWNTMHSDTDTSDIEVAANMSTVEGDLYAVGLPKNAKAFAAIVTVLGYDETGTYSSAQVAKAVGESKTIVRITQDRVNTLCNFHNVG
jgi:hypothetical protein